MRTIRSLVAGAPVDGAPGGSISVSNPARLDDTVAEVELGDTSTFVGACRAARDAQRAWAATPAPSRGRVVQQFGRLVEDNAEALSALITREIGKPIRESRGEVQEVVDTCNFFLSEGRRLYGQTVPSEMPDKQLFTFRTPVGVAAIVTAGNFPVAVPSWYIVPALVCGNAVVWKPAEYTPATAEAFTQLLLHAGVPAGVFSMVLADGPATFDGLERALGEGLVDKIGFTGSTEVGRRIGELAGRHLQTPCLELGGKNPLVVMPDADLDLAVEGALFSGFGTAGQRCTSLGTAIVHADVHDDFLERFAKATAQAPIGDPTADVLYGPMISQRFCDRFETWLELVRAAPRRARLDRRRTHHRRRTRARASSATPRPACSTTRRSSTACGPTTTSPSPRRSDRSSAWPRSRPSTRRWRSRTDTATACRAASTRPTRSTCSGSVSGSPPAW